MCEAADEPVSNKMFLHAAEAGVSFSKREELEPAQTGTFSTNRTSSSPTSLFMVDDTDPLPFLIDLDMSISLTKDFEPASRSNRPYLNYPDASSSSS